MTQENLTRLLNAVGDGDAAAQGELIRVVYDELRQLATAVMQKERPAHTLQPTALVHEAYLRLMGTSDTAWQNRSHFFGAAAEAMRRILVDHARRHSSQKRGGGRQRVPLDEDVLWTDPDPAELLTIDEALTRLSAIDAVKGRIVELRFFGGLSVEETAEVLNLSPRTVKRDWNYAKACLSRDIARR